MIFSLPLSFLRLFLSFRSSLFLLFFFLSFPIALSCFFFLPFPVRVPLLSFGNVCTSKSRVVNDWLDKLSFCSGGEFKRHLHRRLFLLMFFAPIFSSFWGRRNGKEDVYRNKKITRRKGSVISRLYSETNSGGPSDDYSCHAIDSLENYIFSLRSDAEACAFFMSVT